MLFATVTAAAAEELLNFETFKGEWIGSGWFFFADATRQPARCRLEVRPYKHPQHGTMKLSCSGGGMNIEGRAFDVKLKGTKVEGSWEWRLYNVTGVLKGTLTSKGFDVILRPTTIVYSAFSARFSAKLSDNCHASATGLIEAPTYWRKANLSLHRC